MEFSDKDFLKEYAKFYSSRIVRNRMVLSSPAGKVGECEKVEIDESEISEDTRLLRFISDDISRKINDSPLPVAYMTPLLAADISLRIAIEYMIDHEYGVSPGDILSRRRASLDAYISSRLKKYVFLSKDPFHRKFYDLSSLNVAERFYADPMNLNIALWYAFLKNNSRLPTIREIDSGLRDSIKFRKSKRFNEFTPAIIEETYRKTLALTRLKVKSETSIDDYIDDIKLCVALSRRYGIPDENDMQRIVDLVFEYAELIGVWDMPLYYPRHSDLSNLKNWEILGLLRAAVHNIKSQFITKTDIGNGMVSYSKIYSEVHAPMLFDYFESAIEENKIHRTMNNVTFCSTSQGLYMPLGLTGSVEL